jgi:hypothetical protein
MNDDEAFERAVLHVQSDLDGALRNQVYTICQRLVGEMPPYPPAHLTTLARYIHVLAFRVFNISAHPEAAWGWKSDGEFRYQFLRYLAVVYKLNAAVVSAVAAGELSLRDRMTGLVLNEWSAPRKELADKLETAIREGNDRLAGEILIGKWAVLEPHFYEDIAVSKSEFLAWAEAQGVATPGEIDNFIKAFNEGRWLRAARTGFQQDIRPLLEVFKSNELVSIANSPTTVEHLKLSDSDKTPSVEFSSPLQRSAAQEKIILATLRDLGYSPSALPKRPPGKAGPKYEAWAVINGARLSDGHAEIHTRGIFDKAWERLRNDGEIAEVDESAQ